MIWLAFIFGAAIAWLTVQFITAPEGWEDSNGFHLGPEPLEKLGRRLPDADGSTAPVRTFHDNRFSPEAQYDGM